MKVKFVNIAVDERIVKDGTSIRVGEIVDLPVKAARYFIEKGNAVEVAEPADTAETKTPKGKKL